jgi:hypothetical protein
VVHNARLVDRPQKSVIEAPFMLFPKPPWFVTHRNGHRALSRVAALQADPHWWRVPGIGLWAMLG